MCRGGGYFSSLSSVCRSSSQAACRPNSLSSSSQIFPLASCLLKNKLCCWFLKLWMVYLWPAAPLWSIQTYQMVSDQVCWSYWARSPNGRSSIQFWCSVDLEQTPRRQTLLCEALWITLLLFFLFFFWFLTTLFIPFWEVPSGKLKGATQIHLPM